LTKKAVGTNKENSEKGSRIVITSGEIFPDSTLIELIAPSHAEGLILLYWNGQSALVAPEIDLHGRSHRPADLDPSIRKNMPLPDAPVEYGNRKTFFQRIADMCQSYIGFDEAQAKLLALWIFSTWFADCLPTAPTLLVSGRDTGHIITFFRLLQCLCRRPLMLGDISPKSLLGTLPMSLHPTLILNQPELPPKTIALLCNSNHRGLVVPGKNGKVLDICCSKAVFLKMNGSSQEWGDQVVHVTLPPSNADLQPLDDRERERITKEFQPRFLMYRLHTVHTVLAATADSPAFAGVELARNLLACVPDETEVAETAVPLLQAQHQDFIAQRACNLTSAVLEVLWVKLHDVTQEISVGRVADLTNAFLRNRGENLEYSPGKVGWKLRQLKIPRAKGHGCNTVQFSVEVSRRVHQLVRERGLDLALRPETCPECADGQIVPR
jgi:hypothetical protein